MNHKEESCQLVFSLKVVRLTFYLEVQSHPPHSPLPRVLSSFVTQKCTILPFTQCVASNEIVRPLYVFHTKPQPTFFSDTTISF